MVAAFFGIPWWALAAVLFVEEENGKRQDEIPDKLRKPRKPGAKPLPPRVPVPPPETHRKITLSYVDDPSQRIEIDPNREVAVTLLYPPKMVPKLSGRDVFLCWRGGFAVDCPIEPNGDVAPWFGKVKASSAGGKFTYFEPSMQRIGDTLYLETWPYSFGPGDYIQVDIWQR